MSLHPKPERTMEYYTRGEEDSDSYSDMSDNDYAEFSEWDDLFNRAGRAGEVPPPSPPPPSPLPPSCASDSDVLPTPVVSCTSSNPKAHSIIETTTTTTSSSTSANTTATTTTTTNRRYPNGRMGCKSLAALQQQLLMNKREKNPWKDDTNCSNRKDDDDDELQIVAPPAKRQRLATTVSHSSNNQRNETKRVIDGDDDDDGLEVLGVSPGVLLSHPRHGCSNHPFEFWDSAKRDMSWGERTTINMKHCSMCYCYVCEVKADECADFDRHCNANDRDGMKSYWKFQRHKKQEEKTSRHFRFQCAVHMFRHCRSTCPWPVEMWEQRSWFNKRFCRDCVCFVCNKPVVDCVDWSEHCNANNFDDMASFWRFERERCMNKARGFKYQEPVDG